MYNQNLEDVLQYLLDLGIANPHMKKEIDSYIRKMEQGLYEVESIIEELKERQLIGVIGDTTDYDAMLDDWYQANNCYPDDDEFNESEDEE